MAHIIITTGTSAAVAFALSISTLAAIAIVIRADHYKQMAVFAVVDPTEAFFWIAIDRPIYCHEQDTTTSSNHESFNIENFRVSQNQEFLLERGGGRRVRIMSFIVCWGLFLDSIFVETTT